MSTAEFRVSQRLHLAQQFSVAVRKSGFDEFFLVVPEVLCERT